MSATVEEVHERMAVALSFWAGGRVWKANSSFVVPQSRAEARPQLEEDCAVWSGDS